MNFIDLGLVDYLHAYSLQQNIRQEIKNNNHLDTIIFCQHYPVITLGRQARKENILANSETLQKNGIKIYEIDRGGDVTLHNPGQLVIYPIFDLHRFKMDLGWFLDKLENIIIDLLDDFSIPARSISGLRGVWVGSNKIASIGIGVKHWITFHGVSLNICNNLKQFSFIKPCGLDIEMTSLEKHLKQPFSVSEIQERIIKKFSNIFNMRD